MSSAFKDSSGLLLKAAMFFTCLLPLLAAAQTNYRKGLVVTATGDTLHGYVDYREWHYNPDEINFKAHLEDQKSQIFRPGEARYLAVAGYEAYEGHHLRISQDEVANAKLHEYLDTTTTGGTVFLKLLLKGDRVNLYTYKDKTKERFYIREAEKSFPIELGYRVYLEKSQVATVPLYKNQLAALAVKLQVFNLTEQIQTARYSAADFLKILKKLNTNTDQTIAKIQAKAPPIRWFGNFGLNNATFSYKGENELMVATVQENGFYKFQDQIVTQSYLPSLSGGADIYLNPAVQRFRIRGEISLAPARSLVKTHYQHSNYSIGSPPKEQMNTYELFLVNISAAPQLIVNAYNAKNFKFFIGGGSALNYRLVLKNEIYRVLTDQGTFLAESKTDNFYDIRKLGLLLLLRTGVQVHKKLDISLQYSPSARINTRPTSNYGPSTIFMDSFQVSAGYLLK
jgi:hypothetical protein